MTHAHHGASWLAAVAMWQAMMLAMMGPVVVPWIRTYAELASRDGHRRLVSIGAFGGGYFVAWLAYAVVAAGAQIALSGGGSLDATLALPARWGGALLVSAGLVQLTPIKQACLSHCRNPLTYFLQRWHNRPPSGFRLGVAHGAFCVGCCWALMATAFALGVMNLAWMAVLTAITAAEQLLPRGRAIGRLAGIAMAASGILRLIG